MGWQRSTDGSGNRLEGGQSKELGAAPPQGCFEPTLPDSAVRRFVRYGERYSVTLAVILCDMMDGKPS